MYLLKGIKEFIFGFDKLTIDYLAISVFFIIIIALTLFVRDD